MVFLQVSVWCPLVPHCVTLSRETRHDSTDYMLAYSVPCMYVSVPLSPGRQDCPIQGASDGLGELHHICHDVCHDVYVRAKKGKSVRYRMRSYLSGRALSRLSTDIELRTKAVGQVSSGATQRAAQS